MSSARARHADRAAAAHEAATSPNAWRCLREGCPIRGQWQPTPTRGAAFSLSSAHQRATHPDPPAG